MNESTTPAGPPPEPLETEPTEADDTELVEDYDGPSANDLALAERARARRPSRLGDVQRKLLIAFLVVVVVVGIFYTGRMAVTGTGNTSEALPATVERLIPASGAEALRQAQVGIDLADGYDAYLQINGVTVRTAEEGLIKDGTGLVQFQPGPPSETAPERAIETLNEGQNCVTAFVWDQMEGEATAEPVAWCFDAT